MYKFLALLPAVLSFVGFVIYLLWKNKKDSPVALSVIETIRSKSENPPALDERVSAKNVYRLINEHPELREKLSQNDYNLLQYAIKSENSKDYLYGLLTLILVAISIFAYIKIEKYQDRLKITDIELKGLYDNTIFETPTTRDNLKVSWDYEGKTENIVLKVECLNNNKSIEPININSQDDFLIIDNASLKELWGCPELSDEFQLRFSFQTATDIYSFGPLKVSTALTVLHYFNLDKNELEVKTQTQNCGVLTIDYNLKALVWSEDELQIESRDIPVREGKASVLFPKNFKPDLKTLKILSLGDYSENIIRFYKL